MHINFQREQPILGSNIPNAPKQVLGFVLEYTANVSHIYLPKSAFRR